MCAASLPYDMGNAGDMIKHGLLAEYVEWWCVSQRKRIKFLDPFGGRPWLEPPHEATLLPLLHRQPRLLPLGKPILHPPRLETLFA